VRRILRDKAGQERQHIRVSYRRQGKGIIMLSVLCLTNNFDTVCRNDPKSLKKSFINTLLRMVA